MDGHWCTSSYRLSYAATLQASGDQIGEAWGGEHEIAVMTKSHDYNWLRARPLKIKMEMALAGAWWHTIWVVYPRQWHSRDEQWVRLR